MRIIEFLQNLIILGIDLLKSESLVFDIDTFPEKSFLFKLFLMFPEVMDKNLEYLWDSSLSFRKLIKLFFPGVWLCRHLSSRQLMTLCLTIVRNSWDIVASYQRRTYERCFWCCHLTLLFALEVLLCLGWHEVQHIRHIDLKIFGHVLYCTDIYDFAIEKLIDSSKSEVLRGLHSHWWVQQINSL